MSSPEPDSNVSDAVIEEAEQSKETVAIQVPKIVLEYIRKVHKDPVSWIQKELLGWVYADVDSLDTPTMIDLLGLKDALKTDC